MTKSLKDLEYKIYEAYRAYDQALEELQARCEHKVVLGYAERQMENRRICEDCGYEEANRWGNQYRWDKLGGRVYEVSWSVFSDARPVQTYIPDNAF
jgi:hypothetical protein